MIYAKASSTEGDYRRFIGFCKHDSREQSSQFHELGLRGLTVRLGCSDEVLNSAIRVTP